MEGGRTDPEEGPSAIGPVPSCCSPPSGPLDRHRSRDRQAATVNRLLPKAEWSIGHRPLGREMGHSP
ncbi:MAG: hypothetical protein LLG21_07050, partial [Euryarchaeota archaeon]|nr:hypothetical protein [Euryarchaeota archaeon]